MKFVTWLREKLCVCSKRRRISWLEFELDLLRHTSEQEIKQLMQEVGMLTARLAARSAELARLRDGARKKPAVKKKKKLSKGVDR